MKTYYRYEVDSIILKRERTNAKTKIKKRVNNDQAIFASFENLSSMSIRHETATNVAVGIVH